MANTPKKAWQVRALDRHAQLLHQLEEVSHDPPPAGPPTDLTREQRAYRTAGAWLAAAEAAATVQRRRLKAFFAVWRGSDIDEAWTSLHRVEALLVKVTPDAKGRSALIAARERARRLLKPSDHRLRAVEAVELEQIGPPAVPAGAMVTASVALEAALRANDDQFQRLRSFRNILIVAAAAAVALALALALLGYRWPAALSMCWTSESGGVRQATCPTGRLPARGDVALIQILGMAGAAVIGLRTIGNLKGISTPYAIPVVSLIIKLPLGAITATLGVFLLHLLDNFTITTKFEIAAFALIFGASQELFSKLIDDQGQKLLHAVGTTPNGEPATGTAAGSAT